MGFFIFTFVAAPEGRLDALADCMVGTLEQVLKESGQQAPNDKGYAVDVGSLGAGLVDKVAKELGLEVAYVRG